MLNKIVGMNPEAIVLDTIAKINEVMNPRMPEIDPTIKASMISSILINAGLNPIPFNRPTSHCLSLTDEKKEAATKIPVVIKEVIIV